MIAITTSSSISVKPEGFVLCCLIKTPNQKHRKHQMNGNESLQALPRGYQFIRIVASFLFGRKTAFREKTIRFLPSGCFSMHRRVLRKSCGVHPWNLREIQRRGRHREVVRLCISSAAAVLLAHAGAELPRCGHDPGSVDSSNERQQPPGCRKKRSGRRTEKIPCRGDSSCAEAFLMGSHGRRATLRLAGSVRAGTERRDWRTASGAGDVQQGLHPALDTGAEHKSPELALLSRCSKQGRAIFIPTIRVSCLR